MRDSLLAGGSCRFEVEFLSLNSVVLVFVFVLMKRVERERQFGQEKGTEENNLKRMVSLLSSIYTTM